MTKEMGYTNKYFINPSKEVKKCIKNYISPEQ